jgi:hypothetical protein
MASYQVVNQPERDVDHSPPPITKVKHKWSYNSTPPIRLHSSDRTILSGNRLLEYQSDLFKAYEAHSNSLTSCATLPNPKPEYFLYRGPSVKLLPFYGGMSASILRQSMWNLSPACKENSTLGTATVEMRKERIRERGEGQRNEDTVTCKEWHQRWLITHFKDTYSHPFLLIQCMWYIDTCWHTSCVMSSRLFHVG